MNQENQNLAASVRQKLQNLSKKQRDDFQLILTRYALERLLYRLSQSPYQHQFILKGALLFSLWSHETHRPTRDLDLLGYGEKTISYLEGVFREICLTPVEPDGLEFKDDQVVGSTIKENQEYEGVRIKLLAFLSGTRTRIPLQIDIGFGDVVTPAVMEVEFPTILEQFPAPSLRAYPPETVVAEKFQAMVTLGIANTRLKDFYDVCFLAQQFEFQGKELGRAIKSTFERRGTPIPQELPFGLTSQFCNLKQKQWNAFVSKTQVNTNVKNFAEVLSVIETFLMPLCLALVKGETFEKTWQPPEGWQ